MTNPDYDPMAQITSLQERLNEYLMENRELKAQLARAAGIIRILLEVLDNALKNKAREEDARILREMDTTMRDCFTKAVK